MKLTLFNSKWDTEAKVVERDWKRHICRNVQRPRVEGSKNHATLWCPAIFKSNKRRKENVVEVSCVVLDYDHEADFQRDLKPWKPYNYVAHTTYNHTDSEHRFRVIIPLATPIPADKYPALWEWASTLSNGKIDRAASDSSRMYYVPIKSDESAAYEFKVNDGELLDWQKLSLAKPEMKKSASNSSNSNGNSRGLTARRIFDKALRGKNGAKIAALDLGGTAGYKSNSEADQAYCNLISFYTGPDASLIDQVFRQSKRYRSKWDEKHESNGHTYGEITIERALKDHKGGFYKWPSRNGTPKSENGKPKPSEYFERRFPNLAENYGRAVDEGQRDGVLYVRDLNEDFFAATLGEEGSPDDPIVYVSDEGAFWGYSQREGVFIEQDENVLRTRLSKLLLDCARECQSGKTDTTSLIFQHRDAAKARGIFDKARGYLHQTSDYFSTKLTEYLPCANGMLNLNTRQLEPFNPNFRRRNKLGVPYDRSAKCDQLFLDTLVRQSLEPDDQELLQRYSGTVLIGRNLPQVVGMAIGTAGGGKGAFVRVLCGIIGKGNVGMLRTRCLGERFEIGRYNGRTLLLGPDVPQDFLSGASATYVKALVGGDNLTLEFKGSNSKKNIAGEFNVFVTCNSRLKVRIEGDSDAWRRRLRIFDYHKPKPKKPIPDLDSLILANEGSGVLNWMLEGFYRERENHFGLEQNQRQQDRVDNLLLESESHAHFAREVLVRARGSLTVDNAHRAYVEFCNQRGWSAVGRAKFGSLIGDSVAREFGLTVAHDIPDVDSGKPQRGWRGLILRPDDEPFEVVVDDLSNNNCRTPCQTSDESETGVRSVRTNENETLEARQSDASDTISEVHCTGTQTTDNASKVSNDFKGLFPCKAIWRNAYSDQPVVVLGFAGFQDDMGFYAVEGSQTGVPSNELEFPESTG